MKKNHHGNFPTSMQFTRCYRLDDKVGNIIYKETELVNKYF